MQWGDVAESDGARAALDAALARILQAEHLLVLLGLGASTAIEDTEGRRLAPTMDDLWDAATQTVGEDLPAVLERAAWSEAWGQDIELLLSRCQMVLDLGDDDLLGRFVASAEDAIATACRFVTDDVSLDVHEAFLRRVARRSTRLPRTRIFTTNYDLAIEAAASRTGFVLIDGFSHAQPQRFDSAYFEHDLAFRDRERAAIPVDWVPNVAQLHKLHGSVDWAHSSHGVSRDPGVAHPLLIYPRSTKFEVSYQRPFLDLMARYQAALRRPDTGLLVIGSGLRDNHITQPFIAAVETNVRLNAMVVSPNLKTTENPPIQQIQSLVQRGDRRLSLVGGLFQELVPLMPDLMAESDAERHEARLRESDKNG